MTQRTFTTLLVALMAITVAVGCARSTTGARSEERVPAASPSTAGLVGTWRGMAWEVGGHLAAARTDATLQINDDQTWSAHWKTNEGPERTASGTLTTHGDRVVLRNAAGGSASLKHRGDQLYGLLDSAVARLDVEVDLKKVQ